MKWKQLQIERKKKFCVCVCVCLCVYFNTLISTVVHAYLYTHIFSNTVKSTKKKKCSCVITISKINIIQKQHQVTFFSNTTERNFFFFQKNIDNPFMRHTHGLLERYILILTSMLRFVTTCMFHTHSNTRVKKNLKQGKTHGKREKKNFHETYARSSRKKKLFDILICIYTFIYQKNYSL